MFLNVVDKEVFLNSFVEYRIVTYMYDIWTKKLEGEQVKEYSGLNYKIVKTNNASGKCIICCTSNNLWNPNTRDAYEEIIVKKDRYEWTTFDLTQFEKIIYVRDLYKSWYVTGINEEINCIDKLIEFSFRETKGYDVVCIGSSAGGYLAMLLGSKLHAQYVLAFSPQVELNNKYCIGYNKLLQYYQTDMERNVYYDITFIIEREKTPIYYIYPIYSEEDQIQYSHIKGLPNVKIFHFNTKSHGIVLLNNSLRKFVSLSQEEIENLYKKYQGKIINKWNFSIHTIGFVNTLKKEFFTRVKKKIKEIAGI